MHPERAPALAVDPSRSTPNTLSMTPPPEARDAAVCANCGHAWTKHDSESGECAECRHEWFVDSDKGHPGVCYRVQPAPAAPPPAAPPVATTDNPYLHEAASLRWLDKPTYTCRKCGQTYTADDGSSCGSGAPVAAAPAWTCPHCGHDRMHGNQYCARCGLWPDVKYEVVAAAPSGATESIDATLSALEDAMHRHCDQPLRCDFMSLTRAWRDILTRGTP